MNYTSYINVKAVKNEIGEIIADKQLKTVISKNRIFNKRTRLVVKIKQAVRL